MTHYHFIGIGGTGLSAIARVLLERGYQVSGSDLKMSPLSKAVAEAGGQVYTGHRAEQVSGADIVIRSSAIPDENVEVLEALKQGIPVLKRSEFLKDLIGEQVCLAVAGSHGKTTTTALLAWVLTELDLDPGFIVGGTVRNLHANAHSGTGEYFVIEADEYDYMFHGLTPTIAVITNVEHDHPDLFPTEEAFFDAFHTFISRVKPGGTVIYCKDDFGARSLMNGTPRPDIEWISYGLSMTADYQALAMQTGTNSQEYTVRTPSGDDYQVNTQLAGEHNVLNSLAVITVIDRLGLSVDGAISAIAEFQGSERRFEVLGEVDGITVIDDYAHHPTEIRSTLAAARQRYPDARLWVVWEPHTYSRTLTLQEGYESAFVDTDELLITDVFAAREKPPAGFDMLQIVERIEHHHARFLPEPGVVSELLLDNLDAGDVLLVLSAGDATEISRMVLNALIKRSEVTVK